jgi:hypothetical protein
MAVDKTDVVGIFTSSGTPESDEPAGLALESAHTVALESGPTAVRHIEPAIVPRGEADVDSLTEVNSDDRVIDLRRLGVGAPNGHVPEQRLTVRADEPCGPGAEPGAGWTNLRVSVVVPALNEAMNLPHVLPYLPAGLHQVILVDGFSMDDTVEVARKLRSDIEVVRQVRRGKGNALAHGFAAVTGDVVVMLDADGSADPGEIPAFVAALEAGADFAKGSRFRAGGGSSDITILRRAGNKVLNGLVNALYRTEYTDLCYGYNAFWARLIPDLGLTELTGTSEVPEWGDGFEIETLINVRLAQVRARVSEVPSFEHSRLHGVSNLNTMRDGMRVLRTIFRERRIVHRHRSLAAASVSIAASMASHDG